MTDIARASIDRADFENRLSQKGYTHSSVRELRPEIAGIIERETRSAPEGEDLRQFLHCLFVSTFDFDYEASQDKSRVIGLLRLASETRDSDAANSCWNDVFENLSLGAAKAKVFGAAELESIARNHGLMVDTSALEYGLGSRIYARTAASRGAALSPFCMQINVT